MNRRIFSRFGIRFLARASALAGTVAAVSVCGGQDKFGTGPNGADTQAPAMQVSVPGAVADTLIEASDSLRLSLVSADNVRLQAIHLSVTGLGSLVLSVVFDTTFATTGTAVTTYSQGFIVPLPATAAGQRMAVNATATDAAGNVTAVNDTVRVNDTQAPVTTLVSPAGNVRVGSGDTIHVLARAIDPSGIRYLGARLYDTTTLGKVVTLAADSLIYSSRVTTRLDSFMLVVPASLAGDHMLQVFAADSSPNSNKGVSTPVLKATVVDIQAPTAAILSPALVDTNVSTGDSVLMTFRLRDNVGVVIETIDGFALHGDSSLGTANEVPRFATKVDHPPSPTDTTMRRYLQPVAGNLDVEPVFLRVVARDSAGNRAITLRRIRIIAGASVRLLAPANADSEPVGNPVGITVTAFDPDSVKVLGFVSTGAIAARDSIVLASPLGQARSAALSLPVPASTPLSADTITPFFIDALGNRTVGAAVVVAFRDQVTPQITFLGPSPDSGIAAGDSVRVRVRVQDNRTGTSVSFIGRTARPSGLVQRFASVSVPALNSTDTTVARYLPFVGDSTPETVYLVATVTDGVGHKNSDSVRVQLTGGPFVRITDPAPGTKIRLGQTGANILPVVSAFFPDTVTYLGVVVTGRYNTVDSVAVARPATTTFQTQQVALLIPANTPLGTVTLTPFARTKLARYTGTAVSYELIDGSLPVTSILTPTHAGTFQVPAGDSLFVRVAVADDRGLASLTLAGFAHRPDVSPDTLGQVVAVPRFAPKTIDLAGTVHDTVVRYLNAILTDSTPENAYIVATALDSAGNSSVDTVRVQVGTGPYARLTGITNGTHVPVGTRLQLTVSGYDPDTLAYLGYEATGRFPWKDSVEIVRPLTDAVRAQNTLDFWIPLTAPVGVDTVRPFARDRLGGRFYGAPVLVQFVDNSNPMVDIILPDSAGTDSIPVGDSLFVRVRARDDQGVAYAAVFGRWNYPQFGDSTGWHRELFGYTLNGDTIPDTVNPLEFSKFRVNPVDADTTILLFLHPTAEMADSAPRSVWIIAYAEDAAHNVGVDSVLLRVTTGPSVRVIAPVAGATVPMGAPLAIVVRAQNPRGIDSVGYYASGGAPGSAAVFKAGAPLTSTDTFALAIPASGVLDPDTIIPFTVRNGSRVTGQAVVVGFSDIQRPTVTIDTPAVAALPVAVGDSVYLNVHVTDNRGVTRIVLTGTSQRGSVPLGTDTTVTRYISKTVLIPPTRDTNITRYLRAVQADSTSEIVTLRATAFDSSGNAATGTATVRVVGGPKMSLIRPSPGALTSPGRKMVVEVHAVGQRGVHLLGWRAAGVVNDQDSAFKVPVNGALADTASFIDTLSVPALTPLGTFAITVFGVDSLGDVSASSAGVTVVVQSGASDTVPPLVSFAIGRRVEATDSIAILVRDPGGIRRIGWTAQLLGGGQIAADSTPDICCTLSEASMHGVLNLPSTLKFPAQVVVQAFASDSTGNFGVSALDTLTVVAGKTYALPAGSQISDAIFNPHRNELYLSNTGLSRLEVFDLATASFVASIPVGSRPVGLALWPKDTLGLATSNADTVIVANSGGTNLSLVDVTANRREYKRYRLPNYIIQKVKSQRDPATQLIRVTVTEYDFADRPQYVAAVCRAVGAAPCGDVVAVYSTTPTAGQTGYPDRGYLAWENLTRATVDSVKGHFFWEPGTASLTLTTDTLQVIEVRDSVPGVPVRQVLLGAGVGVTADFDRLEFQDSTFVRSSGNYLRSLVGEGGTNQGFARVLAFDATAGTSVLTGNLADSVCINGVFSCTGITDDGISDALFVRDFLANRASSVSSIAINESGRTMMVRADSIYVFDRTLRQTGIIGAGKGATGMDFHPANTFDAAVRGAGGAGYQNSRLLFAARPDSSIDVFDTYFFGEVTDTTALGANVPVPIRNALIGPVRVATYSGSTYLFGLTALGLVAVQLPNLTNSLFPVSAQRPIVSNPMPRVEVRAFKGTSPPRE